MALAVVAKAGFGEYSKGFIKLCDNIARQKANACVGHISPSVIGALSIQGTYQASLGVVKSSTKTPSMQGAKQMRAKKGATCAPPAIVPAGR